MNDIYTPSWSYAVCYRRLTSCLLCCNSFRKHSFNSLRPIQNGRHFADDSFKRIFENKNEWISPRISLTFVPKVLINNIPALVQIMAWRRPGDKPLSEQMMVCLPTHICVTQPQWVKEHSISTFARPWQLYIMEMNLIVNHLTFSYWMRADMLRRVLSVCRYRKRAPRIWSHCVRLEPRFKLSIVFECQHECLFDRRRVLRTPVMYLVSIWGWIPWDLNPRNWSSGWGRRLTHLMPEQNNREFGYGILKAFRQKQMAVLFNFHWMFQSTSCL